MCRRPLYETLNQVFRLAETHDADAGVRKSIAPFPCRNSEIRFPASHWSGTPPLV